MTKNQFVDRIELEIELTKEHKLGVKKWPENYTKGYIFGLMRALELSDDMN